MPVIAVMSTKSSPGATTFAIALASVATADCLVADLDPQGSEVLLRFKASDGKPLDDNNSLPTLAATGRTAQLLDEVQRLWAGPPYLGGGMSPGHARSTGLDHEAIFELLLAHPGFVIADCGRLSPGSPSLALAARADATLLVMRPEAAQLAHTRDAGRGLRTGAFAPVPVDRRLGVIAVGAAADRRHLKDMQALVDEEGLPLSVLGLVDHDDRGVALLEGRKLGSWRSSNLGRSLDALAPEVFQFADECRSMTNSLRKSS